MTGTDAAVVVGEIGGAMEEDAASYAKKMTQADRRFHRRCGGACRQKNGACRRESSLEMPAAMLPSDKH